VAVAVCCVAAVALPARGSGSSTALSQRAQQLSRENSLLAGRSRAAVLTLYALDSKLAATEAELATLKAEAAKLSRQRERTKQQLGIARRTFTASRRHLADRLRRVYEQEGDSDPLAIVLGAKTLDEALSGLETVNAAAATDRNIVRQARASRTAYLKLQRRLEDRARKLTRLQKTLETSAAALASTRAARVGYIRKVAAQRRLNATQIGSLESRAQAIQEQARQIAVRQTAAPLTAVTTPVAPEGRTLTVTATGYTLLGRTATGAPVGYGVVAVDPNVIPLGTRLSIPGYGEGVAADTGGAVQGGTIDLWFPTASTAAAWGRRTVTITLH
jgi:3D (Asp-Asp-Asp) domain-containing protein